MPDNIGILERLVFQDPVAESTIGVLFVCLGRLYTVKHLAVFSMNDSVLPGNICRSPTAEAVFKTVVKKRNMENRFVIDSCGTGGGNPNWYMSGNHQPSYLKSSLLNSACAYVLQTVGPITKAIQQTGVCNEQVTDKNSMIISIAFSAA